VSLIAAILQAFDRFNGSNYAFYAFKVLDKVFLFTFYA